MNPGARYQTIADDIAGAIAAGQYAPGATLPRQVDLAGQYGVARETIREAISVLELRGLVRSVRGQGAIVRAGVSKLDRGHRVRRNEFGYIFNAGAGHWEPIDPPRVGWETAPDDVADVLGIPHGSEVLARHRVVGLPATGERLQYTSTYVVADVARGTPIEQADTGPGGWMDRAEHDLGHGPLTWDEELTARPPTAEEARALGIAPAVWVLSLTRAATSAQGHVIGVDVTRVPADRFAVRYPIERDESAAWPTTPAVSRNTPPS